VSEIMDTLKGDKEDEEEEEDDEEEEPLYKKLVNLDGFEDFMKIIGKKEDFEKIMAKVDDEYLKPLDNTLKALGGVEFITGALSMASNLKDLV